MILRCLSGSCSNVCTCLLCLSARLQFLYSSLWFLLGLVLATIEPQCPTMFPVLMIFNPIQFIPWVWQNTHATCRILSCKAVTCYCPNLICYHSNPLSTLDQWIYIHLITPNKTNTSWFSCLQLEQKGKHMSSVGLSTCQATLSMYASHLVHSNTHTFHHFFWCISYSNSDALSQSLGSCLSLPG